MNLRRVPRNDNPSYVIVGRLSRSFGKLRTRPDAG
jgi:hypothetical protein